MKKVIPALVVASSIITSQVIPTLHDSVSAASKVSSVNDEQQKNRYQLTVH